MNHAVAVLIISCPCALGLAVPAVQIVASGWLTRRGILLKDPTALDRLAEIDTVVFDKTGTLTEGVLDLAGGEEISTDILARAAALARESRHPLARALVRAAEARRIHAAAVSGARELPGCGVEAKTARLGSRTFCGVDGGPAASGPELWYVDGSHEGVRFRFEDRLKPDAKETVAALKRDGLAVALRSGDSRGAAETVAATVGISDWRGAQSPTDKTADLERLEAQGHRVLMIGDGLNDAPALAAARVSMSPSSAADISQNTADIVFQGTDLRPVRMALLCARRARRVLRENIAMAIGYNLLTIPLAMAGFVSPLFAAVAMSLSSLAVVLNSLRVKGGTA